MQSKRWWMRRIGRGSGHRAVGGRPGVPVAAWRARSTIRGIGAVVFAGAAIGVSSFIAAGLTSPAQAQLGLYPAEIERLDVISIQQDGRDLLAFNSVAGTQARVRLDVDEYVLFNESRGRVGIVLTDRRALGIGAGGNFQEARYRISERAPDFAVVSERVALVATSRRALGFVGRTGGWIEESFTPGENVEAIRAGAAVGIAATNRRVLGLAPDVGRFASLTLRLRESLEAIDAQDTLATLQTDQRILVFSGPRAVWTERVRRAF
jgi:hypothetical protein